MADVEETLRRVPLFSEMKPKELKKLGNRMSERAFSQGDTIAVEGETGVGFFVIEQGEVEVSVAGETVATLGPGHYFGEVALIDGGARSATVTAASDLRCRAMSAWEFQPFLAEHPEVAWALLVHLVTRLREAETHAQH
jgi:CRP-like cAMP-binding protein